MLEDEAPTSGIGHNNPPSAIEDAGEQFRRFLFEYEARAQQLTSRAESILIQSRDSAATGADVMRLCKVLDKTVDDKRKELLEPLRTVAENMKARQDEFLGPVLGAMDTLQDRLDKYVADEAAKAKAQQAEVRKAMGFDLNAAIAENNKPAGRAAVDYSTPESTGRAPAPIQPRPTRRTRVVGDYGATLTAKNEKVYTVTDWRAVPDLIMQSEAVQAAIISVAKSMYRVMPNVPGIEITTTTKASVR